MKTHYEKLFKLFFLPAILSMIMFSGFFMQAQQPPQSKEVIEGYVGWAGNPDSLGVYIDTTWTEAEKDSVRAGIARWNDAGCTPKLKEVSNSAEAEITITQGDPGEGNAGLYEWNEDEDGKVTGATITIAEDTSPLSIKEVVTHELGHALGLDDVDHVANAGDVMKGDGPSNGSDGNLSQHDSTEMRQAAASITVEGIDPPAHEKATMPEQATMPGEFTDLNFNLPDFYPPETNVLVTPIEDPLLFVEYAVVEGNQLFVGVFTDPMHGSGKMYLDIFIEPPFGEPLHFWGIHYVNINPVPPVFFECPFEAVQFGDHVMVNWKDYHSYPFPNPLSATLVVDGVTSYKVKPNNDFFIPIEPGFHILDLYLDDYQVNSASSSGEIMIYDLTPPWQDSFEDYPAGSDIVGQGGWEFWFGSSTSPSAYVTTEVAHSGTNSLGILGKPDMTGDDIVHQVSNCNSGVWNLNLWQFIPEEAMQGATYITLLNEYGYTLEECNWSTQLMFNAGSGIVESQFEGTQLPLIKGNWVPIEINIDFDNDLQTISYNGQILTSKSWTNGIPPVGIPQLAAVNLFSGDLSQYVYYDDISILTQDDFGLEGVDLYQISYDWGEHSQENSRVGLLSCKYTPQEQAMFLNAFTVDMVGEIYWIGQNYLPSAEYSSVVQKTTIQFDLLPLGIEPGMALVDDMPLWIVLGPDPLASIPDLPPVDSWPGQTVSVLVDNTLGGVISGISSPGVILDWPYGFDPLWFFGEIEELVYRGCNVPNIDLDDANHGDNAATGYAGDLNACVPAAYSNSIEWLESEHKDDDPRMDNNQNHREAMEDLSGEMTRDADSGTYYRNQLEGKMKYIQKHKLPIKTKFQCDSTLFGVGADVRPEGASYSAENQTGATGKPDWDWFVNEMKDDEDVEMTVEWWDEANNKWAGGHCVAMTGALQLSSGLRLVSFKHDRDQENAGADSVLQEPSAVVDVDGWMTIPSLSRPGFTARITSFVSESYDESISYDRASGTLEDPDGNPVDSTKVHIKARRWDNPDDSLSTGNGTIKYKIIDGKGFWDIDYDDFETPPQPGERIVVTFFDGEKWVTKVFKVPEDGGPIYEDVTVDVQMKVHLDFTEWIQITIPPHKTLKVQWDSVTGCGNTDIVQWNGNDWYVPSYGHWNFNPTGTTKEISNDTDSPQYKRFHCDDHNGFYLEFSLVESTGVTSGSNQSEYATVNLGGMDLSNAEFGNITAAQYDFTYETNAQLGDFPGTIGAGGVTELAVNFEAFNNVYWEDMLLTIDIAEVIQEGSLSVELMDGGIIGKAIVPIVPGQNAVLINIGAILPPGLHTLTMTAIDGLTFHIDCFNLTTVIPLQNVYDFGDCPDNPYPTLLASNGARHSIDNLTYLGALVDAEVDGQPNASATGDDNANLADEDGIAFANIVAGSAAQIMVYPNIHPDSLGYLQGWMDFNNDGDWDDPGEQIFIDEVLHFSSPVCLLYLVPANAHIGAVYARFRLSTVPGLSYKGPAPDGEVEDYMVEVIHNQGLKWIQEPCSELPGLHAHDQYVNGVYNYIELADDWKCNGGVVTDITWWGDYEGSPGAGVNFFRLSIYPGNPDLCLPGQVPSWTKDVPLAEANETLTDIVNSSGQFIYRYDYKLDVPFQQIQGNDYWLTMTAFSHDPANVIWRWQEADRSTAPNFILCPSASRSLINSQWGSVYWDNLQPRRYSEMAFIITSETSDLDFGDAPDSYLTLLASDGARHVVDPDVFLGNLIDAETDGIPTAGANGDDLDNQDDEDGVVFRTPLVAGKTAEFKILASTAGYLNAWLDMTNDGTFNDAFEHVFNDVLLSPGWNTLTLNITPNALPGNSYMRFRFSTATGLTFFGSAPDGEVEDYRVTIYPESWGFTPTPVFHTIAIPFNVALNDITLDEDDLLGVFYTGGSGAEACGGAVAWDGAGNLALFAYGDDATTIPKEGFDDGEVLLWKKYDASSGSEEYIDVIYDPDYPQSDGTFVSFGVSALLQIGGISVTATAEPSLVCEGDDVQLDAIVTGGSGNYSYSWTSDPDGFTSDEKDPVANPYENTTYFVSVTDGGVTVDAQVDVVVQPAPVVTLPQDTTICEGDVLQLNAVVQNYSEVVWTTTGDGVFSDETIPDPIYTPGPQDMMDGYVILSIEVIPVEPCSVTVEAGMGLTITHLPTVYAGSDASVCPDEAYQLQGEADAFDYVKWTTMGNGTFDDENSLNAQYTPGSNDIGDGFVELCLEAYPLDPCNLSAVDCMTLYMYEQQSVSLFTGWNGLSSYLSPYNKDDNYELFDPILNQLVVAYNFQGAFWPAEGTDNLTWDESSGYFLKLLDDATMVFCGDEVANKQIQLPAEWSIIPVLSNTAMDVASVFDTLEIDVKLVVEVASLNLYWPDFDINSIGGLQPGKAYLACMNTAGIIDFGSASNKSQIRPQDETTIVSPWNSPVMTTAFHAVAFGAGACNAFEQGDVLAAFTLDGRCAGITAVQGSTAAVTIFADDPMTSAVEGFRTEEPINFKLFRASTGEVFGLDVEYNPQLGNEGIFALYGISVVEQAKIFPLEVSGDVAATIRIFPNPSEGIFTVQGVEPGIRVSVFNAFGTEIFNKHLDGTTLDLSGNAKGVYFIAVESPSGLYYQKIIIN